MASIQKKGDHYYCQFVHGGRRHTFALGPVSETEAEAKAAQVDYLLLRLKRRLTTLPPGVGIVEFVRHDGEPGRLARPGEAAGAAVTLGELRDRYLAAHANSHESSTRGTARIHLGHLCRHLGERTEPGVIDAGLLQQYFAARARANGVRGKNLSSATIRKEIEPFLPRRIADDELESWCAETPSPEIGFRVVIVIRP